MSIYLRPRYLATILGILVLYVSVIIVGVNLKTIGGLKRGVKSYRKNTMWKRQSYDTISQPSQRAFVTTGQLLFTETPIYAARFTHAKLSCSSCHAEGGIQPFASPVVGVPALFPMFSPRAGHEITLKDRIEECIVRSENGTPVDYNSPEMDAIIAYIEWLSEPQPNSQPLMGRGLVRLPNLKPDPIHGAEIYSAQCAGCHGVNGEGHPYLFPPLWGADSFNDGAGMNSIPKMAAFVQHNMPQNRMGILTAQNAYDVSAFIHNQPRPKFNAAYSKY